MDIQKEREVFLAHMRSIGAAGFMFELDDDGNFDDMSMAYAWSAWQAAKANAVPDTYTPVVLALEDVQSKIAQASFLTMDADNENEVYAVDANELAKYIEDLIEVQSDDLQQTYPNIYRAAKEIWYDNGMVNRLEPIEEKIEQLSAWLKTLDTNDLAHYNEKLNLTDDDLSEVCCGEEITAQEILADQATEDFLGRIFEEEYVPKAQEPSHD